MINGIKIEICIGNVEDALVASKYPIDRIELNSALELGGLSPSLETLRYLKERIETKICCMVRPRGGDFFYSQEEYEVMLKDTQNLLENKADGIVFGFLNNDRTIDTDRTKQMVELIHSYNKEAVFHKAFDELEDQDEGSKILIDCGIDRILTSGRAVYPDILEGCRRISALNSKYGEQIQYLPGGGVRIENIQEVLRTSGAKQIHMTSKKQFPGNYLGLDTDQLEKMLDKITTLS